MNKILYVLPALAILGMLPAADADKIQERIEKLQERIAGLQERIEFFEAKIDRNPDSKKVAKWEARIDRLQDRMADLEDRLQKHISELEAELEPVQTTQTITESPAQQEPRSARAESDSTPPTVLSATLEGTTLTVVFSEAIDFDQISLTRVYVDLSDLQGATIANPSTDSDTLSLTLPQAISDALREASDPSVTFARESVVDVSRNAIAATAVPVTIADSTQSTPTDTTPPTDETTDDMPMIATVTITAAGEFENSGTVDMEKSDLMAFSVDFVNNDDCTYTVLADLISSDFRHSWADIQIHPGTTLNTRPWIIDGHMQPGDIAHLVFGAADDPGTPEREPDTVLGDLVVHIRITEPAGETETPDTTAPDLLSAELDTGTGILTATFSEAVDVSTVRVSGFELYTGKASIVLSEAELETAADSDTLTLKLSEAELDKFNMADKTAPTLIVDANCVADTDGNFNDTEEATLTTV